jgi:hypothetical protein|tara:strand:+ start:3698 stop:4306 length:609 start_codon:yes stop_codon:yes gene_type:complete
MSYRKINYLNRNRIIYNRDPITDKPTKTFTWGKFYKNGTYECYELFKSKAKITSFKSLKWHLLVLKYLNPELEDKDFNNLAYYITNKKNNFITFNIKEKYLIDMLDNLEIDQPPVNRKRKVVFHQQTKLTTKEKLQIVGQLIGRSSVVKQEDIYQCMLNLHESNEKITWTAVANLLKCSVRTVYRNLNKELKIEKINLNEKI